MSCIYPSPEFKGIKTEAAAAAANAMDVFTQALNSKGLRPEQLVNAGRLAVFTQALNSKGLRHPRVWVFGRRQVFTQALNSKGLRPSATAWAASVSYLPKP